MAIRPEISLAVQVPDISQAFARTMAGISQMENIRASRGQEDMRNQLLEAQVQTAQAQVPTQQQTFNRDKADKVRSWAIGAKEILPDLEAGNLDRAEKKLLARKEALEKAGIKTDETVESLGLVRSNPKQLITNARMAIEMDKQMQMMGSKKGVQFGAQETFKDEKGNLFFGTQKRDPTGAGAVQSALSPIGGGPAQPVGRVSLVSGLGQTAAEKQAATVQTAGQKRTAELEAEEKLKPTVEAKTTAARQAITKSGKAFDQLEKINANIANYDEAIRLIDEGAQTGAITSMFPNFRSATVQLQNVQDRLGLDVIGSTTFGALSASELKFALDTALPTKLAPPELKRWLVRKKDAVQKLAGYVSEAAQFLGTPGNTVADWAQLQQVNQIEREQPQEDTTQVINFDAQGNIIQ